MEDIKKLFPGAIETFAEYVFEDLGHEGEREGAEANPERAFRFWLSATGELYGSFGIDHDHCVVDDYGHATDAEEARWNHVKEVWAPARY